MQPDKTSPEVQRRKVINLTLASVAGQVGCLTLIIVLGALFGGLWLDKRYDTKPLYTAILMIASIPISLGIMFFVVKMAISKIKPINPKKSIDPGEEEFGKNT